MDDRTGWPSGSRSTVRTCGPWPTGCWARSAEAEDAVQEAWLRLSRTGRGGHREPGRLADDGGRPGRAWTCCARARRAARSRPAAHLPRPRSVARRAARSRRVLADSVGLALLVVLDTLDPAERLAFVLHDMFGLPFDEIAPLVGRSTVATRQLASRARRRVQGSPTTPDTDAGRASAPWSTRSSPRPATASSTSSWRCSTRRSCCAPRAACCRRVRPAWCTVRAAVADQALLFRRAGGAATVQTRPVVVNGVGGRPRHCATAGPRCCSPSP